VVTPSFLKPSLSNRHVYHESGASSRSVLSYATVGTTLTRLALLIGALSVPWVGYGFSSGAYGGFSGAPGEETCRHCHKSFPLNVGGGLLTVEGFPDVYAPGETYAVTVTLSNPTALDWGFQATVLNEGAKPIGKLIVTDREHTKIVPGIFKLDRRYVEQKKAGHFDDQRDSATWTFAWRAPKKPRGPITIYVSGNAGNDNDKATGDFVYAAQKTAQPGA
jgi:hypothetical protein